METPVISDENRPVQGVVIPSPVVCTYCGGELDEEESSDPRKSESDNILCDECWSEEYEERCAGCWNTVAKTEVSANPGEIIAVWRTAPARFGTGDLEPGYYRVKQWPIYADGMIEGYMYADHLEKVADLDEEGKETAEDAEYLCSPLCEECRKRVEGLLG